MTSQRLLDSFLGVASCVSAPTFPHVLMFTTVRRAAKFPCQRMFSLIHLQQTHCDSVHRRANRATIQLLGTGSPLSSHRTSSQCTSQSGPGRMAAQHPEKKHFPSTCLSQTGCEFLLHQDWVHRQEGQCPCWQRKLTEKMSCPENGASWY